MSIDWFTSKPVLGKIWGYNFRLRKRTLYSNPFTSYLYGQLEGDPAGTRVVGRFRVHPFARFFVPIWFSVAVLFVFLGFMDLLERTEPRGQALQDYFIGFGPLPFGILAYGIGRLLGRWGEPDLKQFLMKTLSGRPITVGEVENVTQIEV